MALPVITPRTEITRAYKNIEDALGGIEGDVTALDGRVTQAELDIVGHGVRLNTAESDIITLESQLFKGPIFLSPSGMYTPGGLGGSTPTLIGGSTHVISLAFADAATQDAHGTILLPNWWSSGIISVSLFWTVLAAAATVVRWVIAYSGNVAPGDSIGGAASAQTMDATVPAVSIVQKSSVSLFTYVDAKILSLRIRRLGTHANDTFTGTAYLLAVGINLV